MKRFFSAMMPTLFLLASAGCGGKPEGSPADGPPRPGPGHPADGGEESSPEIKKIMFKLGRGDNSLTSRLGVELKEEHPTWETIQGQAREYAQFAADLEKYKPSKGSMKSWVRLTAAYTAEAAKMDEAARVKDKDAALAAHGQLIKSCKDCHHVHNDRG